MRISLEPGNQRPSAVNFLQISVLEQNQVSIRSSSVKKKGSSSVRVSLPSSATMSHQASPFKWTFTRGDLHALLTKSPANGWLLQPDGIRHRNSEGEYFVKEKPVVHAHP